MAFKVEWERVSEKNDYSSFLRNDYADDKTTSFTVENSLFIF